MLRIPELDQEIFLNLDFFSLQHASKINRYSYAIIHCKHFWQKKLQQDYHEFAEEPYLKYRSRLSENAFKNADINTLYRLRNVINEIPINVNGLSYKLKKIQKHQIVLLRTSLRSVKTVLISFNYKWYTQLYNNPVQLIINSK